MERIGNERTGCSNIVLPVAAGQEIMPGTMVALNADGYAVPASRQKILSSPEWRRQGQTTGWAQTERRSWACAVGRL